MFRRRLQRRSPHIIFFLQCALFLGLSSLSGEAYPDVAHLDGGYHYAPPATSYGVPIQPVQYPDHPQHLHFQQEDATGSGGILVNHLQAPSTSAHVNFRPQGPTYHYVQEPTASYVRNNKNFFYFAAPDDFEDRPRLRINVQPSGEHNTNVVFVKAPNYQPPVPDVYIPRTYNEDKTKIVFLVKKPEFLPINVPAPFATKTKPEVVVVKYQNQLELERAISEGAEGTHGTNLVQLRDRPTFVKEIEGGEIPHNDKYSGFDGKIDINIPKSSDATPDLNLNFVDNAVRVEGGDAEVLRGTEGPVQVNFQQSSTAAPAHGTILFSTAHQGQTGYSTAEGGPTTLVFGNDGSSTVSGESSTATPFLQYGLPDKH